MTAGLTRVCLHCRVLTALERCELDNAHPVVDLTVAAGVAALGDEVWSAPRFAAAHSPEARIAAVAAVGLATAAAMVGLGPIGLATAPVALGAGLLARLRGRRPLDRPRGIHAYLTTSYSTQLRRSAILEGDERLIAPFSGRACVGYSFFFTARETFGGAILVAGGAHGGFVLHEDNEPERRIVAEAGSFRLGPPPGDGRLARAPADAVDRFLRALHPDLRGSRRGRPVLPFDSVEELCLLSGARVEVHGPVVEAPMSYRSAGRQLRFALLPQVMILEGRAPNSVDLAAGP